MKIWVWMHHIGTPGIKSERIGSLTSLQHDGTSKATLRRSFLAVAYTIAIVLASSNLLTPLYAIYQRIFHFSPRNDVAGARICLNYLLLAGLSCLRRLSMFLLLA